MNFQRPDGKQHRSSTKEQDIVKAGKAAINKFKEFEERQEDELLMDDPKYEEFYNQWLEDIGVHKGAARLRSIKIAHRLYYLPFFGKLRLSEIKSSILARIGYGV